MKAYIVSCGDEDGHGQKLTFAESSRKADRYANAEVCDCPYIERRIRRAPQFDKYAPGPVTTEQYLAEGWFFPCGKCEKFLYSDDSPIVTDRGFAFCSRECLEKHLENYRDFGPNAHHSIIDSVASMDRWIAAQKSN